MQVSVDFEDGRICEFNLDTFTASEPYKYNNDRPGKLNVNVCTEFHLRLDLLRTSGLRVDVYYNGFGEGGEDTLPLDGCEWADGKPRRIPYARRHVMQTIQLVSQEELECATCILVRRCGEVVRAAWRQGSGRWLIDGQAFARCSREVYTDAAVTSINAQEMIMLNYLHRAYPDAGDEDVAAMTGFPVEAVEEIAALETLNMEAVVSGEEGFGDEEPGFSGDEEEATGVSDGKDDLQVGSEDDYEEDD